MKVILVEDVPTLGQIGALVNVKNGYARNFLLPRTLAVVANDSNRKELEHKKKSLEAKRLKQLGEAKALGAKIEKIVVALFKQTGEEGRIFGSVTTAEIAEELLKQDVKVSKKDIVVSEDIKKIGQYSGEIRLHSEVTAKFAIKVDSLA